MKMGKIGARFLDNQTKIIQAVFLKWEKSLAGLSRSLLLDAEEARDIVQESFQDILDLKKENLTEAGLKNYLFQVVRNKSLNRIRKKRNFLKIIDKIGDFFFPDDERNIENNFDFRTILMKLSIKHRTVLYLKIKEEYTNDEIAEILEIPVGTVKSRINEGLKILRRDIGEL